jgi:uncharacterized iron-regulated membrane protein
MRRRALVLRLHLGLGLAMAAALLLVGTSGAILVFRSELDEAMLPVPPAVEPRGAPMPLQALVDAALRRHPGAAPASLLLPERADRAARVGLTGRAGEALDVLVDPYTADVLGSRWQERSPLHALRTLHVELYMGPRGTLVVAVLALALLAQGATGLYLWWPFTRRPARGFAIRWPRPWRVLTYDLHKTVGVASLAFNLPVALTGALLAVTALGPSPPAGAKPPAAPAPESPLALDALALSADAALPGGRIVSLRLARDGGRAVVRKRLPGELDPRGASLVVVDRRSGAVLETRDARNGALPARLWGLVGPLHYGDFAGLASKALYFAGGLAAPVLVVSGLLIWLTRPQGRARR